MAFEPNDSIGVQGSVQGVVAGLRSPAVSLAALMLVALGCSYGPIEDHGRFVSATYIEDIDAVVFSWQTLLVEKATGLAAFPNGGVPRYSNSRHGVGLLRLSDGQPEIIRDEANVDYLASHGAFHVALTGEGRALLSQGGQLRRAHERGEYQTEVRFWLFETATRRLVRFDLEGELRERGRAMGQLRSLEADGTIVVLAPSLEEKKRNVSWNRDESIVPELWLRMLDGRWQRVAKTNHFEQYHDYHAVWWESADRKFRIMDTRTGQIELADRFSRRPRRVASARASIGNKGRSVHFAQTEQNAGAARTLIDWNHIQALRH